MARGKPSGRRRPQHHGYGGRSASTPRSSAASTSPPRATIRELVDLVAIEKRVRNLTPARKRMMLVETVLRIPGITTKPLSKELVRKVILYLQARDSRMNIRQKAVENNWSHMDMLPPAVRRESDRTERIAYSTTLYSELYKSGVPGGTSEIEARYKQLRDAVEREREYQASQK